VALGVLPCGTANVWAQELGLPMPRLGGWLAEAARMLAESEVRAVDLGRANGRAFLLWAGVGLDAHITAQVNPGWLKRTFGRAGYIVNACIAALRFRGVQTRLVPDGGMTAGQMLLVVASNVQLYAGGVVRLDERARLDDGLLEAWAFEGEGLWDGVAHLVRLWQGRHWGAQGVWQGRIRRMRIETEPATLVHLDGDPVLRTPVEIEVMPGALRALVPREAGARLFGQREA
jgi:diacylglycerol kinase family enzyme